MHSLRCVKGKAMKTVSLSRNNAHNMKICLKTKCCSLKPDSFRFCSRRSTRIQFELCGSYRFSEAAVLRAALHVEGLDLSGEATEQDGLVDGVRHHPLWSFGDVLGQIGRRSVSLIKNQEIYSTVCNMYPYKTYTINGSNMNQSFLQCLYDS